VAGGAIDEDAVDALVAPLRGADRDIAVAAVWVFLVDHAQRLVTIARQVLRADFGQRPPDPVGEAHFVFAAGRAVLEVLGRAGVIDRNVAAEALEEQQADEAGQGDGENEEDQEAPLPGAGRLFAGAPFEFFVHGASPFSDVLLHGAGRQGRRAS
jgi:hypothetical protein